MRIRFFETIRSGDTAHRQYRIRVLLSWKLASLALAALDFIPDRFDPGPAGFAGHVFMVVGALILVFYRLDVSANLLDNTVTIRSGFPLFERIRRIGFDDIEAITLVNSSSRHTGDGGLSTKGASTLSVGLKLKSKRYPTPLFGALPKDQLVEEVKGLAAFIGKPVFLPESLTNAAVAARAT